MAVPATKPDLSLTDGRCAQLRPQRRIATCHSSKYKHLTFYSFPQTAICSNLEGFDERPKKGTNSLSTTQELDEAHYTEETEKTDAHEGRPARLQTCAR